MLQQARDDAQRTRCNISSNLSTLDQMLRMADAGRENLRIKTVVIIDNAQLFYEVETVVRNIVKATNKGRNIARPCLRCQNRLACGKDERTVSPDTLTGKPLNGFYPVADHRHFNHNLVINFRQLPAFRQNRIKFSRDNFRADVVVYDVT